MAHFGPDFPLERYLAEERRQIEPGVKELNDRLDVQAGWLGMETPEKVSIDVDARDGDRLTLGATEARF